MNLDHIRNSIILSRKILHSRKLPTLKLFGCLLNQACLTVSARLLLLLLYTPKLAHIYRLGDYIVLLKDKSWLLLLIVMLYCSSYISIHLKAVHYLSKVLLLNGKMTWSFLLIYNTWLLRLSILKVLGYVLWVEKFLHHVLGCYSLSIILSCISMNVIIYCVHTLIVDRLWVSKTFWLVASKFWMTEYRVF